MSGFFGQDNGPQPPKILRTPIESFGCLRQLAQQNTPLTLIFSGRSQRYLTYVIAVDLDNASFALDELVPEEGQRLLASGEPFRIDAYLEGVHIHWRSSETPVISHQAGHPAAWFRFPAELHYHQKRNAYRAKTLLNEPVSLALSGNNLHSPLSGRLLDLSATGCKVRFEVAYCNLQPGQLFSNALLTLPGERISLDVEVRHARCEEKQECSVAGFRFHQLEGQAQRSIDRYVNHLQREARRNTSDSLF